MVKISAIRYMLNRRSVFVLCSICLHVCVCQPEHISLCKGARIEREASAARVKANETERRKRREQKKRE